MSALLAAQGQSSTGSTTSAPTSPSAALQNLFSQIDANGDGQITKSEFENALGAGGTNTAQADKVFSQLTNGSGTLSLGELASALRGAGGKGGEHHHHHEASSSGGASGSGSSGASADALTQALQAASATSVTNSNGSTTTSLTYADGSTVSMTTPAATATSSAATSSYNNNIIEQMIARQANAFASSATASLAVSA
jgi:hypothetical protein